MLLSSLLWSSAWAAEGNFVPHTTTVPERVISFFGMFVFVGLAWLLSERRKDIDWKPVIWAIGLQLIFGLIVLSPALSGFFLLVNDGVNKLLSFSNAGATFVFQSIEPHMVTTGSVPDLLAGKGETKMIVGQVSPAAKTFAFWILPTIIFFSTLMSILYHLGIMQVVVKAIAWVMIRTMGTSGAETLSTAGNIFVGQTEAPLLVKPFLPKMTRSELMAVMVGGFATVAGGVLGAYVGFLQSIPNIAGHLVVASILSAPAAFAMSKVIVPETEEPLTRGKTDFEFPTTASNVIEAGANGAAEGMKLAINVAAMLIAAVALVAMADWLVSFVPVTFCDGAMTSGYSCAAEVASRPLSMSDILGVLFAPLAFVMGVPWSESPEVGRLLGEKLVLTEFIAYIHLGELINGDTAVLSQRSAIIASYGLCGFANFASIGIQIGGIGAMAPERIPDLASLGLRAMLAGALACCMTGCVVGILV
jgi:CNT family concentrative nucleoside transporter